MEIVISMTLAQPTTAAQNKDRADGGKSVVTLFCTGRHEGLRRITLQAVQPAQISILLYFSVIPAGGF